MATWAVVLTWLGAIALFVVGFVGIFIPVLPGIGFIYAGIILYALVVGGVPTWFLIAAGVLTVLMIIVDYISGIVGAKGFGASKWGIWGAMIGLVAGLALGSIVAMPFMGLLLGPLAGAIVAELIAGRTGREAMKAGLGTFIGFLAGTLMKVLTALLMMFVFFLIVILG